MMQLVQSPVIMISSAAFRRQLSAPQSIRVGRFFDAVHRRRDREQPYPHVSLSRRSVPHCLSIGFRLSSSPFLFWENDTPAFWSEVIQPQAGRGFEISEVTRASRVSYTCNQETAFES